MAETSRQSEMANLASLSLREIGERALIWWLRELQAMVPAALVARAPARLNCPVNVLVDPVGTVTVKSAKDEVRFEAAEADALSDHLASLVQAGRVLKVRLDLPRSLCLIRSTYLPKRALRSARQLLAAEAAENTPLSPDAAHWDWYVESEDPATGNLLVRHVIVGHDRVADLSARLEAAGLQLAHLTVGHGDARPLPIDLLAAEEPGLRGFVSSMSWPARLLWAASLVTVAALPSLLNDRADRQLADLQAARVEVMSQIQSRPVREADAIELAGALRAQPSMAAVLEELSRRMPKTAVLQSVEQAGNVLTVRLAAGDPEETRRSVMNGPLFEPLPGSESNTLKLMLKSARPGP